LITDVAPESPARNAKLAAGDRIVDLDGAHAIDLAEKPRTAPITTSRAR